MPDDDVPVTPPTDLPHGFDAAAVDDEAFEPAPPTRLSARRVALLSLRLVAGTVALVAAAATVAAVGLIPLPSAGIAPIDVTVAPDPADEFRVCAAALRLGDESGANADVPQAIGVPSVRSAALEATLDSTSTPTSDAGTGGSSAAPEVLRIDPGAGSEVAGAQSQVVDAANFRGFSAAACAEPSGSIWLAGGATTVGRTSILTLTNPTAVAAEVSLQIFGEEGEVDSPGMAGIEVAPGTQRVLSLAGFAPGLASPVVHVEARGGQVAAYLQQSIVRGLDATGVDLVDAAPDPATELTFPGVQIFDAIGVNRALSLDDWDDVAPVVRILDPGTVETEVTVSVTPLDPAVDGTSFPVEVQPGVVTDVALDSGAEAESGVALADGTYTVTMTADQPIVGGVRVSASDIGAVEDEGAVEAPVSDFAWYSAAPVLSDDALVIIAPGPDATLVAVNPTRAEVSLLLEAQGGADITLVIPAGGSASTPVVAGTAYVLREPVGLLVAGESYASDDRMAAYPVTAARPVSGPIVIRP